MEFSRQEHWSGLPFPTPGDLPDPGVEPRSPTLQVDCHVINCNVQNFKNYIHFLNKMAIVITIVILTRSLSDLRFPQGAIFLLLLNILWLISACLNVIRESGQSNYCALEVFVKLP